MRCFAAVTFSVLALASLAISIAQAKTTDTSAEADLIAKLGLHPTKVNSEANVITAILTCLGKNDEAISFSIPFPALDIVRDLDCCQITSRAHQPALL